MLMVGAKDGDDDLLPFCGRAMWWWLVFAFSWKMKAHCKSSMHEATCVK